MDGETRYPNRQRLSVKSACVTSPGDAALSRNSVSTPFSAARIEATSVMSPWTGSTPAGTLPWMRVANERADPLTLPGEPLHDLRSDGAGATCDENGHRPAPCCKPKTVVDDVANKCGLETGLDGKRAFHIRNAE